MRLPWAAVAAGSLVVVVGAAGLIRGAVPQSSATPPSPNPIVVTGAYIRPPLPPNDLAAMYFTVYNTTGRADRLTSVQTGAGATATLHADGANGSMSVDAPGGVVIPAHGTLALSAGKGHVMIGGLYGTLTSGDEVNVELQFRNAGLVDVVARVIPFGPPVPAKSGSHSSGAHK
ncbi:MAG: copper chaperone PCu(A)C [Jatrophihabitans sp.]